MNIVFDAILIYISLGAGVAIMARREVGPAPRWFYWWFLAVLWPLYV